MILGFALLPAIVVAQGPFFDSNGVRIRYSDQGSGDPIVLIHGGGGSLEVWLDSGVLPNLVRDHRVIALDVRGHGKSDRPHEAKAYGREMGLDVVRLMDHLGIHRAHIVGYSLGAFITAQLLTSHPERFITATLGGATGPFQWTQEDDARGEIEASEMERECISRSQIFRLTPANQPKPSEEDIQKRSAACMADPARDRFAQAALSRSRKDFMITPSQVTSVKVPTLGVVGSLDGYVANFQELKALLPALRLVVIDGATHGGERAAHFRPEFVAAVRQFISSHPHQISR
ncbi:MAG: alpha/beta hydrolase [Burkholderiales bacterium]|nr:alpha/beta hydrolase [Burkholderiales bacterium]